ncbi:hypothetical protein Taro_024926 [Colocasia esculenta]|uniref:Uncharacterized protein n=1 Tax=Colocasia esculenta TaxID=4460 RepID=A0A843V8S3_COLES|nr:hypothetical protein [Colocasia esculenta]
MICLVLMLKPSEKANPAASMLRGDSLNFTWAAWETHSDDLLPSRSRDFRRALLLFFSYCLSKGIERERQRARERGRERRERERRPALFSSLCPARAQGRHRRKRPVAFAGEASHRGLGSKGAGAEEAGARRLLRLLWEKAGARRRGQAAATGLAPPLRASRDHWLRGGLLLFFCQQDRETRGGRRPSSSSALRTGDRGQWRSSSSSLSFASSGREGTRQQQRLGQDRPTELTAAYSSKGTLEASNATMDPGGKRYLPAWMSERGAHKELWESGSGESRLPFQAQASREASGIKAANYQSSMRAQSGCEEVKQTVNHSCPMNEVKLENSFPASEDDVGLTVEDLVSIAEEYVNADKRKQHRHEANEEYRSEAQDLRLSVFSQHPFGVLGGAARSSPQISKCTTIARSSCSIATEMVEDAPHSISRTGDVAQDMLDVLLGPLLRKPGDGNMTELGKKT